MSSNLVVFHLFFWRSEHIWDGWLCFVTLEIVLLEDGVLSF
jgi:hypothetical protein